MVRLPFAPVSVSVRQGANPRTSGARRVDASHVAANACEPLRGPGWFDSSWDLRAGLEVREGLPEDLRLEEWLDAFCAIEPRLGIASAAA